MTYRHNALLILILIATWLCFDQIDAQSFWNDEGNSARLSERSVRLIIEGTASDVHPPLYYLILRGYRNFVGESEFALRSVSAFASVLLVAVSVPLTRYAIDFRRTLPARKSADIPLWAALFVASSPALAYYAQEARMYTLLPLLVALATVTLLRWQRNMLDRVPTSVGEQIAYVCLMTAGLYTHYFFPIVFVMHALFVFAVRDRKQLVRWLSMAVVSAMLFAPWLPFMLNGLGGNRGVPQPPFQFVSNVVHWLTAGDPFDVLPLTLRSLPLLVLAAGIGLVRLRITWRAWVLFGVPILALIGLGATDGAFYKFTLVAASGLAMLLGVAVVLIYRAGQPLAANYLQSAVVWRIVAMILVVGWGGVALDAHQLLRRDPAYARADYRGMAARISAENHPNAGIILNAPNQWEVFTYYHQQGAPVYPLPRTWDAAVVQSELEAIGAAHDRLYVLYWGDAQQDPNRWVENWLAANAFKASEEWVSDVRFVMYALPESGTQMPVAVDVNFDDQIALTTVSLNRTNLLAGDVIQTALTWEALQPLDRRYKIFVHLLGADGLPIAQKDSEPDRLTIDWTVGESLITQHGILIPPTVADGTYRLTVGLYDAADPTSRLSLFGNPSATYYEVGLIEVGR